MSHGESQTWHLKYAPVLVAAIYFYLLYHKETYPQASDAVDLAVGIDDATSGASVHLGRAEPVVLVNQSHKGGVRPQSHFHLVEREKHSPSSVYAGITTTCVHQKGHDLF